ncbi:MAG: hypothetical protein Q4C64_03890 [Erysipelotrichia bacterium]|nr:hypothetical protein [Erysipelotrichia bacterium]
MKSKLKRLVLIFVTAFICLDFYAFAEEINYEEYTLTQINSDEIPDNASTCNEGTWAFVRALGYSYWR